jgi:predicted N-acetyltransferase YhbS
LVHRFLRQGRKKIIKRGSYMDYEIRLETEHDYGETENITREAFWDVYKPGCDEHLVAHKLRSVEVFVKELDYVACHDTKIIGNIMYSKAKVVDANTNHFEVLCLGPVCVLPQYQGQGIGKSLIAESIKKAKELQYNGIFLMGNPAYYSKFGFVNAKAFDIQTSEGGNFDYFMGLELVESSLKGITGRFFEDEVFMVDTDELVEFEKKFPKRKKHVTDTQLK